MKRFGTLVFCYEFGWSLAGFCRRGARWAGKTPRSSALNPSFIAEIRVGNL